MAKRARVQIALRLPYSMVHALRLVRTREGVGVTQQIEQAVSDYLKRRGMVIEAASRGARTPRKASTRQQR